MAHRLRVGTVFVYIWSAFKPIRPNNMAFIRKLMASVVASFAGKSAIPSVRAADFEAAVTRASHSAEECRQVTQSQLAKLQAAQF